MYVIMTPGNSFVGLGSIAGACSSLFLCVQPSPAWFGFKTAFTLWSVGGQARGATPHRGAAAGAGADGAAGVCWAGVAARPGRDGGERGPGENLSYFAGIMAQFGSCLTQSAQNACVCLWGLLGMPRFVGRSQQCFGRPGRVPFRVKVCGVTALKASNIAVYSNFSGRARLAT